MKRKPVSTIEKIARIMIALTIGLAGFVGVFLAAPAYAANIEPVSVVSSLHVTYPNNVLVQNSACVDPTHSYWAVLNNEADTEIVVDYGASYSVDAATVTFGAMGGSGNLTLYLSNNGSSWTEVGTIAFDDSCHQVTITGFSGTYRYARLTASATIAAYVDSILINVSAATATPTSTAQYATPFPPQPTACVTAMPSATATRQASPTPLIQRTPTPGGPTATPGPTATGTPFPSFDSGVATFAQSLQPWTATEHFSFGGLYVTEWRSATGPDGTPGVAFTKDFVGLLDNPSGPLTTTEPLSGSLTFSRPGGMFFPFRVTGSVKWSASILGGESAYLRVWYFDPDYSGAGQGAWVTDPPNWRDQFSSDWGHFSFSLTQHGGSGRVTAVAISEELDGTERSGEGALLDNLRVYSGPQAVAGSFPVCQGSGAGGPRPIVTKTCNIKQIVVDVYASCTAPTSLIDVVGWLSYWFCRILRYFSFLPQNRQQVTDLIARQNADEPFGTLVETSDIIGVIGNMLQDISATYSTNAVTYRTIDWGVMWNFAQLDDIPAMLHVPNDPGVLQRYRANCPPLSQESMNGNLFRQYGCLIIVFTRDKLPLLGAFQWVIDISAIIGLVISARKFLSNIST